MNKILIIIFLFISATVSAQIQFDKVLHFTAGFIITVVTEKACFKITNKPVLSKVVGSAFGIGAGAGKELIWDDYLGHGQPSAADFYWTAAGSGTATLLTITIKL